MFMHGIQENEIFIFLRAINFSYCYVAMQKFTNKDSINKKIDLYIYKLREVKFILWGISYTCVLTDEKNVYVWGENRHRQTNSNHNHYIKN